MIDYSTWVAEHAAGVSDDGSHPCDDCGADPCYCDALYEQRFEK